MADGLCYSRMAMAECAYRNATDGVQKTRAFVVPEPSAFAVRELDRQPGVGVHQVVGASGHR